MDSYITELQRRKFGIFRFYNPENIDENQNINNEIYNIEDFFKCKLKQNDGVIQEEKQGMNVLTQIYNLPYRIYFYEL